MATSWGIRERMLARDMILCGAMPWEQVRADSSMNLLYDCYAIEMPRSVRLALGDLLQAEEIEWVVDPDATLPVPEACLLRLQRLYAQASLRGDHRDPFWQSDLGRWRERFTGHPYDCYRAIIHLARVELRLAMKLKGLIEKEKEKDDSSSAGWLGPIEKEKREPIEREKGASQGWVWLEHKGPSLRAERMPSPPLNATRGDGFDPDQLALAIQMSMLEGVPVELPDDPLAPVVYEEGVGWVVDDRRPPVWAVEDRHKSEGVGCVDKKFPD